MDPDADSCIMATEQGNFLSPCDAPLLIEEELADTSPPTLRHAPGSGPLTYPPLRHWPGRPPPHQPYRGLPHRPPYYAQYRHGAPPYGPSVLPYPGTAPAASRRHHLAYQGPLPYGLPPPSVYGMSPVEEMLPITPRNQIKWRFVAAADAPATLGAAATEGDGGGAPPDPLVRQLSLGPANTGGGMYGGGGGGGGATSSDGGATSAVSGGGGGGPPGAAANSTLRSTHYPPPPAMYGTPYGMPYRARHMMYGYPPPHPYHPDGYAEAPAVYSRRLPGSQQHSMSMSQPGFGVAPTKRYPPSMACPGELPAAGCAMSDTPSGAGDHLQPDSSASSQLGTAPLHGYSADMKAAPSLAAPASSYSYGGGGAMYDREFGAPAKVSYNTLSLQRPNHAAATTTSSAAGSGGGSASALHAAFNSSVAVSSAAAAAAGGLHFPPNPYHHHHHPDTPTAAPHPHHFDPLRRAFSADAPTVLHLLHGTPTPLSTHHPHHPHHPHPHHPSHLQPHAAPLLHTAPSAPMLHTHLSNPAAAATGVGDLPSLDGVGPGGLALPEHLLLDRDDEDEEELLHAELHGLIGDLEGEGYAGLSALSPPPGGGLMLPAQQQQQPLQQQQHVAHFGLSSGGGGYPANQLHLQQQQQQQQGGIGMLQQQQQHMADRFPQAARSSSPALRIRVPRPMGHDHHDGSGAAAAVSPASGGGAAGAMHPAAGRDHVAAGALPRRVPYSQMMLHPDPPPAGAADTPCIMHHHAAEAVHSPQQQQHEQVRQHTAQLHPFHQQQHLHLHRQQQQPPHPQQQQQQQPQQGLERSSSGLAPAAAAVKIRIKGRLGAAAAGTCVGQGHRREASPGPEDCTAGPFEEAFEIGPEMWGSGGGSGIDFEEAEAAAAGGEEGVPASRAAFLHGRQRRREDGWEAGAGDKPDQEPGEEGGGEEKEEEEEEVQQQQQQRRRQRRKVAARRHGQRRAAAAAAAAVAAAAAAEATDDDHGDGVGDGEGEGEDAVGAAGGAAAAAGAAAGVRESAGGGGSGGGTAGGSGDEDAQLELGARPSLEELLSRPGEQAADLELLGDLDPHEVSALLEKVQRKGKGGRAPAEDPRLDPSIDPRKARRILANRISAARSKLKQKLLLEGLKARYHQLLGSRSDYQSRLAELRRACRQLEARNRGLAGKIKDVIPGAVAQKA